MARGLSSWIVVGSILFYGSLAQATFLPDEEIRVSTPANPEDAQITEAEFNRIVSRIQSQYVGLVTPQGGKLSVRGDWKNDKIVARASQLFGAWNVEISGGLARRPELTPDGFTLILCHEVGHHLAGFPISADMPLIKPWSAAEGQADYYATHVCAKRLWSLETEKNATFRALATEAMRTRCDLSYAVTGEQDLCYRTLVAAQSVVYTMAALKGEAELPKFETPDPNAVPQTSMKHPATQCRMDTSLQGALCSALFDDKIIPGKSAAAGVGSIDAEREAARFSCMKSAGYSYGLRPTCWFKARL